MLNSTQVKNTNIYGVVMFIAILSSLYSDLIPGVTMYGIFMLFLVYCKYIIDYGLTLNKYAAIIHINIIIILLGFFKNGVNFQGVKYIFYYLSIFIIFEIVRLKSLKQIFNLISLSMFFISIYVIYKRILFNDTSLDLVNIRNEIIIQKQSFNILYTVVIPYNIYLFNNSVISYKNKLTNKKELFKRAMYLITYFIVAIFILQIKSLIITIFLGYIISYWASKKIKISKVILYLILFVIGMAFTYMFNLIPQLTPIIDYMISGNTGAAYGNKYVDTLLLRDYIIKNLIESLKSNLLLGIGYGNYYKIVSNLTYYIPSKGIYMDMPTVTEFGFLNFLVEGGLLGLIGHIILIFNLFMDISRIKINEVYDNKFVSVIFTCTIALIISNFLQDNLNFTYWFFLGICIGVIVKNRNGSEVNEYFNYK